MNKGFFTGNVGNVRMNSVNGQNGPISVLNFSLGVRKKQKDQQGNYLTLWVDCSLWGRMADTMQQYVMKGTKLAVEGDVDIEMYQANDGSMRPKLTLRVNDIELLSSRQEQQGQGQGQHNSAPPPANNQGNQAPPPAHQHQQQTQANQPPPARTAPPPAQQQTQAQSTLPDDDDIPF